jgi:hypothetical protein
MNRPPAGTDSLQALARIHTVEIPDAEGVNRRLVHEFAAARNGRDVRRSHHFHGRFENTYIERAAIPALEPLIAHLLRAARTILDREELHFGFWFNEMQPGQCTSLHSHEELDELLSAVYYVTAPADAGDLVLHDDPAKIVIRPTPGLAVLFPPDLPHEVRPNRSDAMRLSVAFNFGPAGAAC